MASSRDREIALMAIQELTVSGGSFDTKERVKQAVDIVDLVGSHIQLRRQGRNYVGLCPWHDDSRPSLQVNPERQSFKCWVCDIGGDVFSFVMKMEGVDFPEALQMLADRAGITLEKKRPSLASPQAGQPTENVGAATSHDHKRSLLKAMAWAEEQYHQCLLNKPEADAARRYLQGRGITAESIERFRLGFSPLERDWILRRAQGGDAPSEKSRRRIKTLETIGILVHPTEGGSPFDRLRGRVLFSIHDGQGRPVGLGGRVLPELGSTSHAKYVNSPETPLFTKSKLLYGLDLARDAMRKTRTALVMEGYTDVIVAHQYGFQNAVAVLGTALGESHVRLLKAHVDRVVLVLDGDEAGTRRANEVLGLFIAQQADLRILTLPEDLDPCDYLHKYGAEAFADLLTNHAVDALDHAFNTATRGIDVERDIHGASQAIDRLLEVVARAPHLGVAEMKVVRRLAGKFHVDELELRHRLAGLRRKARQRASFPRPEAAPNEPPADETGAAESVPASTWELAVLQLVVAHPEIFETVSRQVGTSHFANNACRRIFETCCRLADDGDAPTFERLMLAFDAPAMKSLLVEIDETSQATGQPSADAETLLRGLLETQRRSEIERQRPARIGALREGGLDDDAQKDLLLAAIRQERSRQGISEPTDG